MNNKLYVGSLNFAVTQQDLQDFFLGHGSVLEAVVVTDRSTGNSRGFGFVTMASENDLRAIEELNGKELLGQEVNIKLALDRERGGGGRGGHRGGGGGRGGHRGSRGHRGGGERRDRNWDR